MITLSPSCVLEIAELSSRAEHLAKGNASDKAQSTVLVQRISTLRQTGESSDELRKKYSGALLESLTPAQPKIDEKKYALAFRRWLRDGNAPAENEMRTILAGQQSITYTNGSVGGYLVPQETATEIQIASAQTDPTMSPDVTSYAMEDTASLNPYVLNGYDLSTISAIVIAEATQQTAESFVSLSGGKVLRGNLIYKSSFEASLEADMDIPGLSSKIATACGVSFGRSMGADSIIGVGGATRPLGLLNSISPSYTTGTGKITLTDLLSIHYSVNRYWRAQPRCAWMCSDSVAERIHASVDNSGRPLISIVEGQETLLGKPLYVSPSMGAINGSPLANGTLAFGDFGQLHLRQSRPTLQRVLNSSVSDITQGKILFIARSRFDSLLYDPSNGAFPPIVTGTVTA